MKHYNFINRKTGETIIEYIKQDSTKGRITFYRYDKWNTDPNILEEIEKKQSRLLKLFKRKKSSVKYFNIYQIDYKGVK